MAFLQKIKFRKGNKTKVKEVTAYELGIELEKGWVIEDIIEVIGEDY